MEYQVTATRRRPQRFEDLLGQEFVAATLQKSIETGKIAHAYLFSGPRGCGKTSSARILAKVLNCAQGPAPTPCGTCTACTEITAGSCLDVIEIDGASNTGVNDVRQIKDEILFPPNSNRYKIYIIDEVHMLSTSAFNALLKTIEEPPPYVVFIFATTEIHKVPATIKSRCQQFNFKLVSVEVLKQALEEAAAELNIKADDEALYWVAREATGSVRDAYTLFDQVAAFSDGHITFEKIREKLGLTGIDSINKLVCLCVEKNGQEALNVLDEILQNGISVEQFISDCADYFRSLLLVKHGITKEALIGQRADRFPPEVLNGWSAVQIEQALSIMLNLFKDIRFSLDPRYELELAVSRLSWLADYVSPNDLKRAFEAAKHVIAAGSSAGMSAGSPAGAASSGSGLSGGLSAGQGAFSGAAGRQNGGFGGGGSYGSPAPFPNEPYARAPSGENPYSFSNADSLTDQFRAVLRKEKAASVSEKKEPEHGTAPAAGYADFQSAAQNGESIRRDGTDKTVPQESGLPSFGQTVRSTEQLETAQTAAARIGIEDLDAVKKAAEENLLKKNGLLSSAVAQSLEWRLQDDVLHISAKTAFDASLFEKQKDVFRNVLENLTGVKFKLAVTEYREPEKCGTEGEDIEPLKIRMLTEVFMGKIVDKRIAQEQEVQEEENAEPFANTYRSEGA